MTPKTILIIEDETALLYALQTQLSAEGFHTIAVADGIKALAALKNGIDAIVLDLILPGIDGWQLLKKVKNDTDTKDIPVIIISNLSDDNSRKQGLNLGAKDYLAKVDYSVSELVDKIKSLI